MELVAEISLAKIKKIEIYQNTRRLYMSQIKSQTGADYIINGGIFSFQTFKPFGNVKINGKIVGAPGYREYGYAWNTGADLSYERLPSNRSNYIGCVPMVLNGTKQVLHYNADMGGSRQRSAMGVKNGNLVLYASNGIHSKTPEKLQQYAISKDWSNGIILDGGGSTQAMFGAKALKSTENGGKGRIVQNYILVYLNKDASSPADQCPYTEPTVTIRQGSRGEGAKWVQWQLNRALSIKLTVNGIFGSASVTALKRFQKETGLTADGLCGAATRAALKKG